VVEDIRQAEEALQKRPAAPGAPRVQRRETDYAGFIRSSIFKGLCINPNPRARAIVEPYLRNPVKPHWDDSYYYASLAILRSGDPGGLEPLLDHWSQHSTAQAEECFLLYTAAIDQPAPQKAWYFPPEKAKAWYALHRDDPTLRDRIARVNQSGLSQSLADRLREWP